MTFTTEKRIGDHQIGERFEGFLLVKDAKKGVASNGQPFLTLLLVDKSGKIDAKLWNVTDEQVNTYPSGKIAHLTGTVSEYRGSPQLNIQNIRPQSFADTVAVEDFLEEAPVSESVLRDEFESTLNDITNPVMQQIVRAFIERYNAEFFLYPAATSIHHGYIRGLAYHTGSMAKIGKSLCDIYPEINKSLLLSGIVLHDIGKIHEFVSAHDTNRSLKGNLMGHIPIMATEIKEVANQMGLDDNCEEVLLLQHMVLSHHGKPEWGSARTPLIREAELLHHIDNIDAKLNTLNTALAKTEPGNYTEKLFALDNRAFYQPTISS